MNQESSRDVAVRPEVKFDFNVSIPTRARGVVRAAIFRSDDGAEKQPVLMSMGVYGKNIPMKQLRPDVWPRIEMKSGEGSHDYLNFETPLPDFWVSRGYVVVRCDQPGSGDTPGRLDVFGPEAQAALYDAIEWAGSQPWSNGKVGLLGASYYGVMQWLVAQHQPKHLAAILPFTGFTDHYRDCVRHGGILTAGFIDTWYEKTVLPLQYGAPHGTSSEKLGDESLALNTAFPEDYRAFLRAPELAFATHEYYLTRTPDLSKINVPVYAWANNDGFGLHLRGTIYGFENAVNSAGRWLQTYSGQEPDMLYTREICEKHLRFFDFFLKGIDNGFNLEPAVSVAVKRNGVVWKTRQDGEYPPKSIEPRRLFMDCTEMSLLSTPPQDSSFAAYESRHGSQELLRFSQRALDGDMELVGPIRLHLTMATPQDDADLFVAIRELRPDGSEVTTRGSVPISMGWQRASMRHSEPAKSTVFRTWHTFDRHLPLQPGRKVSVDVNLWPAAWILEAGNTLVIEIGGSDQKGVGEYTHPPFGPYAADGETLINNASAGPSQVTVYSGGSDPSYIVLPVISVRPVG